MFDVANTPTLHDLSPEEIKCVHIVKVGDDDDDDGHNKNKMTSYGFFMIAKIACIRKILTGEIEAKKR